MKADYKYMGQRFLWQNFLQYQRYLASPSDVAYQRSSWQGDSLVSKVIYNGSMYFPVWHGEMDVLKKQCLCIKCSWELHKIATETSQDATMCI